jgi:hypothetical protein
MLLLGSPARRADGRLLVRGRARYVRVVNQEHPTIDSSKERQRRCRRYRRASTPTARGPAAGAFASMACARRCAALETAPTGRPALQPPNRDPIRTATPRRRLLLASEVVTGTEAGGQGLPWLPLTPRGYASARRSHRHKRRALPPGGPNGTPPALLHRSPTLTLEGRSHYVGSADGFRLARRSSASSSR